MKRVLLAIALASVLSVEAAASNDGPDHLGKSWFENESAAFADARASGRHVVVVFGALWCSPCKKIEQIMNDDIVYSLMSKSFVPLYFDITDLSDSDEALQAKYHVPALPAVIFVDVGGRELGRWKKNLSPRSFISAMQDVVAANPLVKGVSP